jgi:pyruvate/2-oxoglutarate dehydrogenase complex dihydrolipoamide dehydrogenase (E3) component
MKVRVHASPIVIFPEAAGPLRPRPPSPRPELIMSDPKRPSDARLRTLEPDLCIIGGGPAGFDVALAAGLLSVPTLLIDKSDLTDPLPRGLDLVWTHLAAAARRRARTRSAPKDNPADWKRLVAAARAAAAATAPETGAPRLRALSVDVLQGTARFTGPRTLEVGGQTVAARRFIVATGARIAMPGVPGLDLVAALDAATVLDLPVLPRDLLILGGGEEGATLAQIFARFGSRVALIDTAAILGSLDGELRRPVLAGLAADGVALHHDCRIERIEPMASGLKLWMASGEGLTSLEGSHLLCVTGSRPNIAEWRPEAAGIKVKDGSLVLGADGRTSNPRIYAIGGVTGTAPSVAAARQQAGVALRAALFRLPGRFDQAGVAQVMETDPEVATIGLDEAAARAKAASIRLWRAPLGDTGRARAEGVSTGHIKVITSASGRLLGAAIVGREAREMIGLWTLAIRKGLDIGDIADLGLAPMSFSDVSRRAALASRIRLADNPWLQRALTLMRRLG